MTSTQLTKVISFVVLAAAYSNPQNALAATTEPSNAPTPYEQCMNEASSNMAMKMCAGEEFSRQDLKLNEVYKKKIAELKNDTSEDGKEILSRVVKAERAWITFRDTSCLIDGVEMLGGTGEGLIITECKAKMTEERVKYIQNLFTGN